MYNPPYSYKFSVIFFFGNPYFHFQLISTKKNFSLVLILVAFHHIYRLISWLRAYTYRRSSIHTSCVKSIMKPNMKPNVQSSVKPDVIKPMAKSSAQPNNIKPKPITRPNLVQSTVTPQVLRKQTMIKSNSNLCVKKVTTTSITQPNTRLQPTAAVQHFTVPVANRKSGWESKPIMTSITKVHELSKGSNTMLKISSCQKFQK
jgi:hypothetical protein